MHQLGRISTFLTLVLAGIYFVPAASALPGAGLVKQIHTKQASEPLLLNDESSHKGFVTEAGLRIYLNYGRSYPRYSRRYRAYPSYRYGYRRHIYRPYKYRRYRNSRRYKRQRAIRRLRRLMRHRLYY